MTLPDTLIFYRDPDFGVVSRFARFPNADANYNLWTAMVIDLTGDTDLAKMHAAFIAKCWVKPGLLARRPSTPGDSSWDEFFGAAYTGWFLGIDIAHAMLVYGLDTDDSYDVERPEDMLWPSWYARNLTFIPFLRACGRMKVGPWSECLWALGALLSLFSKYNDTSGKNLIRLQRRPMSEVGLISRLAIGIWNLRMSYQYPGGEREFLGILISGHPMVEAAPEIWRKP